MQDNQINNNGDPIDKLHGFLKAKGHYDKGVDEFRKQFSTPEKIDKLYGYMNSKKLYDKSNDDFYNQFFTTVKKKETAKAPTVAQKPTASIITSHVLGNGQKEYVSALPSTSNQQTVELGGGIPSTPQQEKRISEYNRHVAAPLGTPLPKNNNLQIDVNTQDPVSEVMKIIQNDTRYNLGVLPATSESKQSPKDVLTDAAKKEDQNVKRSKEALINSEKKLSYSESKEKARQLENVFRYNQDEAVKHIGASLNLKNYNDIYNMSDEELDSVVRPENATDKLSIQAIKDAKAAKSVINNTDDVLEAAIQFEAYQDPLFKEQLDVLSDTGLNIPSTFEEIINNKVGKDVLASAKEVLGEKTLGGLLFKVFNNPIFEKEVNRNPHMASQFKSRVLNFLDENKEFGKVFISNKIANRMEQMGMNNSILNIVTKAEADKVVDDLVNIGEMDAKEAEFYRNNIRGDLGLENLARSIIQKPSIKTTGILDNIPSSGVETLRSMGEGIGNMTGINRFLFGDKELLSKSIERDFGRTYVKPVGVMHEISQGSGNLLGQVLSTGITGKGLQAFGLSKIGGALSRASLPRISAAINNTNTAIGLAGIMQAYGTYMPEARKLFPGQLGKQRGYTAINAGITFFTERIFNDAKLVDKLMKKVSPDVRNVIDSFTDKQISATAAREAINSSLGKALNSLRDGFPSFLKSIGQNEVEELSQELGSQVTEGVFSGVPISESIDINELGEVAKSTLLSTPFLAALSARADLKKNRVVTSGQLYAMGMDADYWRGQIRDMAKSNPELAKDADDKIKNIDAMESIVLELENNNPDMSFKKKAEIALIELDNRIKKEKLESSTTDTVKNKIKEDIKKNNEEIEDIASRKDDGDDAFELELSKEDMAAAKILGNYSLPGMYGEMAETNPAAVLKDIAQQALGLDQNGNPVEGGSRRQDMIDQGFPSELIDEAISAYGKPKIRIDADKLESLQPKNKENAIQEPITEEISVDESSRDSGKMDEGVPESEKSSKESEDKSEEEKVGDDKEPPKNDKGGKSKVHVEYPATNITYAGLQKVATEFELDDVKSKTRVSDLEMKRRTRVEIEKWVSEGSYVQNINRIINEATNEDRGISKVDELALEFHLASLSNEARKYKMESKEYDNILKEMRVVKSAAQKARGDAGTNLRAVKGGSRGGLSSIDDMMVMKATDSGVEKLTPEQKEYVRTTHDKMKEKEDAIAKKMSDLSMTEEKKRAQDAVEEMKKGRKKSSSTKSYVDKRQKLIDRLKSEKDDFKGSINKMGVRADGGAEATVISAKMAKTIVEIAATYIEEGVDNFSDLVKKVRNAVSYHIDDITEDDIIGALAGRFNEKKPTRNEYAEKLRDMKHIARLTEKLNKILSGEEPKSPDKKVKRNQEIADLKKRIKDELKRLKYNKGFEDSDVVLDDIDEVSSDTSKLNAYKKRVQNEIDKISEKIDNKDYSVEEKKSLKLDKDAINLKRELEELKFQWEVDRLKDQYSKEKIWSSAAISRIAGEILNVPRSLMSSGDFSAPLRQAIFPTLSNLITNPKLIYRAFGQMFKSAASQKNYDNWMVKLQDSKRYEIMKDSGLAITDMRSPELSAREEAFMGNLAEKIPILGTRIVKGSNRAYTQYLNMLRAEIFEMYAAKMESRGLTWDNSKEQYKQLAKYVNNTTGRGDLGSGKLEDAAPFLNSLLFSPRLLASRINMATYVAQPRFWKKAPREVREAYAKDVLGTAIVLGVTLFLAKMAGAEVEEDPRSTDFGKLKFDNTRYDIYGGLQPIIRLAAQLGTAEKKSTTTGKIQAIDGSKPFSGTPLDTFYKFIRTKLSPTAGIVSDLIARQDIMGNKIDLTSWENEDLPKNKESIGLKWYAMSKLLPINVVDAVNDIQDDGVKEAVIRMIPALFGVGVQTYD